MGMMVMFKRRYRRGLHVAVLVVCLFLTGHIIVSRTSLFPTFRSRSRRLSLPGAMSNFSNGQGILYSDIIEAYWSGGSKGLPGTATGGGVRGQRGDDPPRRGVVYWERDAEDAAAKSGQQAKDVKVIAMRDFPSYYEIQPGSDMFQECPGPRACRVAVEASDRADLVILYSINSNGRNYVTPPPRPANQIWAYFAVESPPHSASSVLGGPAWRLHFNWTMTYRLDSDVRFGYGLVVRKPNHPEPDGLSKQSPFSRQESAEDDVLLKRIAGKTKMAAIFVSNCWDAAKRLPFLKLLQEGLPGVDVYGACGTLKCEKGMGTCHEMLARDYFFYLAFENSLCVDYATEKLYKVLQYDVVPVVRGGANYSNLAPPMSVIDTAAFQSILDLARYLQYLKDNPREYVRYLRWKREYEIVEPQPLPWCQLCSKVHDAMDGSQPRHQAYDNVDSWWTGGTCREPSDLHILGQF